MNEYANATIVLPDAPAIPGLTFRGFGGEADYTAMVDVINGSKGADDLVWTNTVQEMAYSYKHLLNCDPYRDMLFVEVQGEVVGYSRVWWYQELSGQHIYSHFCFLLPEWREQGIRRAMLLHNERRLREIAVSQDNGGLFQAEAADTEDHWATLLSCEDYEVEHYEFDMFRPNLDDIPDALLPEGLEIRPARPEHYRIIWKAAAEAFRDNWGATEWTEDDLTQWQASPLFAPELWQVAWEGQQVAGVAWNHVDRDENVEYERQRGYVEQVAVRRPWRRRGLARALLARSLRSLKEQGMTEAALGVDGENSNEALRFYQNMGFYEVKRHLTFCKPLD